MSDNSSGDREDGPGTALSVIILATAALIATGTAVALGTITQYTT